VRRAILAVCGTVAGTALLVGAKSGSVPAGHGVALDQAPQPGVGPTAGPTTGPSAVPTGGAGKGTPAPTKSGVTPTGAATTSAALTGTRTTAPATGGGYHDGTYAGSAATYQYGTIKVTIVVSGGRITQATATYPTSGQSGTINGKAIPKLNQETLQAQSADVATISGASLTSGAYRTSLQAAVDRARG